VARGGHAGRRRHEWPAEGPRPGDPAGAGPRPPARFRDGFWLALAGALAVVTLLQLVRLVHTVATSDEVQVTGGGAFLGFLVTVVWLLTIAWLVAGAWRRSVWGCPFEHTEDAHLHRRCQRHALVPAAADGPADEVPTTGSPQERTLPRLDPPPDPGHG
jgi:hypothetical protein